ncbi:MAG: helix-turn-helix domain-containing protein [Pseudomonadales bacterium]
MSDVFEIDSVEQCARMMGAEGVNHPLIHVVDMHCTQIPPEFLGARLRFNLYCVVMKKDANGQMRYGRNQYDFSCGVLTAFAPGQVIEIEDTYNCGDVDGWGLIFHPDILLRHPLKESIGEYGFFSYGLNEALHLSEREQQVLKQLVSEIDRETQQNLDSFSLDILLANIGLLLTYTDRYFNRQFLTRRPLVLESVERFNALVDSHFARAEQEELGLPSVAELATQMNMSASYLSDLLRRETGSSAMELIHARLIEKAKYLLLNSDANVSTIAYQLGFEYPQYFSRIFKKKTSMSPQAFRQAY